jgi:flagellar protein FliO/FliZ
MKWRTWLLLLLVTPAWAVNTIPAAPAGPSSLMGLVQVVFGLVVVLAAILGCAWLFRRMSNGMVGIPRHLRVVSAVMVGQRERVVIVELGDEWLVLGVTAQSVNLLSSHPKPLSDPDGLSSSASVPPFARWLKAALERRNTPSDDLKQ